MTEARPRVLVVDDDFSVRDSMEKWLEMDGHEVVGAEHAEAALARLQHERFDLALVDIRMPGMDGVELQRRIADVDPTLPLVIITAYASIQTAVEVLKRGAMDYLTKPVDPDDLSRLVRRALERRARTSGKERSPAEIEKEVEQAIVGQTPAIIELRAQALEAARSDQPVLLTGEPGSGRHTLAATIHSTSARRFFDLVPVDCASLTEENFQTKLLGGTASASPPVPLAGAPAGSKGRLQLAGNGSLLLDRIDQLPSGLHGELRSLLENPNAAIETRTSAAPLDFRPLAISRRPLLPLVESGQFAEGLYYRLAILTIETPPLRTIGADIPQIAAALLQRARERDTSLADISTIAADALERLVAHRWTGNVAELESVIRRAAASASPPQIVAADLGQLDSGDSAPG
jgi:two-component system response regulator HydG